MFLFFATDSGNGKDAKKIRKITHWRISQVDLKCKDKSADIGIILKCNLKLKTRLRRDLQNHINSDYSADKKLIFTSFSLHGLNTV